MIPVPSRLGVAGSALRIAAALALAAVLASVALPAFRTPAFAGGSPSQSFANGAEWPSNFRPYGPESMWNRAMPADRIPRFLPDSDAIVRLGEQNAPGRPVRIGAWGSGWDEGHPIVFASTTDPLVVPHCRVYCNPVYLTKRFRIPARARPGDGGDHHLGIVQPDGTEIDLWAIVQPNPTADWKAGDTLSYGGGNYCGNFFSGPGFGRETSTVGGGCLAAGIIRAAELRDGSIRHALVTAIDCGAASFVFPASQATDTVCTAPGPHVPNGAHLWLDLSDEQVEHLAVEQWEKTVLRALHHYGAYVEDTTTHGARNANGLFVPIFEDDAQYAPFGVESPILRWARAQRWQPVRVPGRSGEYHDTTWYRFTEHWKPVDWAAHLHIVDPCYAEGNCSS